VQEWVGHWRGGLLLASIASMYLFSGMSGSKAADVATVGSVMKGPLHNRGYPETESVAVLAAAAAMGEVIPPSIALLILGSITTLSIGTLFVAGIVPAAVLALALAAGVLVRAHRYALPKGPPFRMRRALGRIPPAVPALIVPVIVLGGIVFGVASPTEASSFAVVYGLLAATLVYRSVSGHTLWTALKDASAVAGMVLLMMSTANLLSQAILMDQLAAKLSASLEAITNPDLFLFLSLAVVIVLGFVLEGFPAILIAAPILLPIATRHGVDPLHYGVLLTMAVGIGVFMPPFGIGYYIACAIGGASPHQAIRPSLFYTLFLVIGLVLAILVPGTILGLPRLLGM
jgi:C4-dicarboxylate transporter, DctM subunit